MAQQQDLSSSFAMNRSSQAFMSEQAAAVEPEVALDEEAAWDLLEQRLDKLDEVNEYLAENHPPTEAGLKAFDALSKLF